MRPLVCGRLFAVCLLALPLALLPAAAPSEAAKASDAFFAADAKVESISLEIDNKAMDALRREPRKYAKATLKVGDKTYKDVGVHVKGAAGSWRGIDDKPGLTVNMNKFGQEQLFNGMDKFHLANSAQDGSFVQELICGELFRAAGVPASRVSHALVTINGKKKGLYYFKEGYDKFFRKRHFGTGKGNFYDGGFLRDIDQPLQLLSGTAGLKDQKDVKKLAEACREGDRKKRFEKLSAVLEVDKFVSYLCLQTICWDWDGYPLNRNNYRIYFDEKTNKATFLPSGMDQMFGDTNGTILPGFNGMAARALMDTPEGRKLYVARMRELMEKVVKIDDINKRLDGLQKKLVEAVKPVDANWARDYPGQINRQKQIIKDRLKSVERQLKDVKK